MIRELKELLKDYTYRDLLHGFPIDVILNSLEDDDIIRECEDRGLEFAEWNHRSVDLEDATYEQLMDALDEFRFDRHHEPALSLYYKIETGAIPRPHEDIMKFIREEAGKV